MSIETLYCDHMIHNDDPCGKCEAETNETAARRDLERACREGGYFRPILDRLDAARAQWEAAPSGWALRIGPRDKA